MGKLYFHCGDFSGTPQGTEALGSLLATGAQMSQIGKDLRVPEGESERHVFSNNQDAFHGVQLAVIRQDIPMDDLVVVFRKDGKTHQDLLDQDGIVRGTLHEGFFDQAVIDLMEMMD